MGRDRPASLSLERFAQAKTSGYDKRTVLEKERKHKLNQLGKYKRLLHRLETQGKPAKDKVFNVKDNVEELEQLMFDNAPKQPKPQQGDKPQKQGGKRAHNHIQSDGEEIEDQEQGAAEPAKRAKLQAGANTKSAAGKLSSQVTGHKSQQQGQEGKEAFDLEGSEDGAGDQHGTDRQRVDVKGHAGTSAKPEKQRDGNEQRAKQRGQHASGPGGKPPGKHMSRTHMMMQEAQQRKLENQKAREEAAKVRAEREAKAAAAQKARQEEKHRFFQRTRTGQPLMRYRMEKILNQLQHS